MSNMEVRTRISQEILFIDSLEPRGRRILRNAGATPIFVERFPDIAINLAQKSCDEVGRPRCDELGRDLGAMSPVFHWRDALVRPALAVCQ